MASPAGCAKIMGIGKKFPRGPENWE